MGSVNRTMIASVIIIMAAGIYKFFLISGTSQNTSLTRIIVGGYMLGLLASFLDLLGPGVGQVVQWLLLLTAGGILLYVVLPDLAQRVGVQTSTANEYGGVTNPHQNQV